MSVNFTQSRKGWRQSLLSAQFERGQPSAPFVELQRRAARWERALLAIGPVAARAARPDWYCTGRGQREFACLGQFARKVRLDAQDHRELRGIRAERAAALNRARQGKPLARLAAFIGEFDQSERKSGPRARTPDAPPSADR